MSDTFDIEEQRARIRRALDESEKFSAEQRKLMAEEQKLSAEERKLSAEERKLYAEERKMFAEALKLQRDRLLSPWLAIVAVVGGIGGLVAGVTAVFNLVRGWH